MYRFGAAMHQLLLHAAIDGNSVISNDNYIVSHMSGWYNRIQKEALERGQCICTRFLPFLRVGSGNDTSS